ncbi:MAG: hypothetical protein O3A84_08105 [Proteobacteria bacterium]|nr:hypothetical protein [Pseudomonadota bacterium]
MAPTATQLMAVVLSFRCLDFLLSDRRFGAQAMSSGLVIMLIIFACWAIAFRQITGRWPRGDEWLPE